MPQVDFNTGRLADNATAVTQSVVNRCLTPLGERYGKPNYGTRLTSDLLRDNAVDADAEQIVNTWVRSALNPDADWYTVNAVDVQVTEPLGLVAVDVTVTPASVGGTP